MRRLVATLVLGAALLTGGGVRHAMAARVPTYHINYVYLTPTKVVVTNALNDYTNASAGQKFLVIYFHAVNRDDVPQEMQQSDMHLSVSGRVIEEDFSDPTQALNGQVMEPGGSVDGGIAFAVPVGAHSAILLWNPDSGMYNVTWPVYKWRATF